MRTLEYEATIDDSQVDILGHVNNARYLEIFEAARWDLAKKSGLDLRESVAKNKIAVIVLEINVKFKKELRSGDRIKVASQYASHTSKIFEVEQRIIKEKGEISAIAAVRLAPFDLTSRKIIDIPKDWITAFEL